MRYLKNSLEAKFGVDAGNISVVGAQHIIAEMKENLTFQFDTSFIAMGKPGWYDVTIQIKDTWNGDVEAESRVYTDNGTFYVGDACYMFNQFDWDRLLEQSEYFQKPVEGILHVNTGGDGCFKTVITVTTTENQED